MKTLLPGAVGLALLSGALSLGVLTGGAHAAPKPPAKVDMARLYSGRWLEVARKPMTLTDGCERGGTAYAIEGPGKVRVRDDCKTAAGKEKSIVGHGTILDPGTDSRLRVRYNLLITWEYDILDHDPDYRWFISADPKMDKLWIYARDKPSAGELQALVRRAAALGYDTAKLEFPAQP